MKQPADPRRWATGWLAGLLRAMAEGRVSVAALSGATARARACGLSNEHIAAILANSGPSRPRSSMRDSQSDRARH
jgi:hypothetical protein